MKKYFFISLVLVLTIIFSIIIASEERHEKNYEDIALAYFAKEDNNYSDSLMVLNQATRVFPNIGRSVKKIKIFNQLTHELKVIALDVETGEPLDEKSLITQEKEEYIRLHGKIEPRLKKIMKSSSPSDLIPVIIWLKEPDTFNIETNQNYKVELASKSRQDRLSILRNEYHENSKDLYVSLIGLGCNPYACQFAPVVSSFLPNHIISEISSRPDVTRVYYRTEPTNYISSAVSTIRADTVWTQGITGSGVKVAVLEPGAVEPNAYFNNIIHYYPDLIIDQHATQVASVIASKGISDEYKGVAFSVPQILSANFGVLGKYDMVRQELAIDWAIILGATVINASFGNYTFHLDGWAKMYDRIAYNTDVLFVAAAGNKKWPLFLQAVDSPALAYNVLAVGGFHDFNDSNWDNDLILDEYGFCYLNPASAHNDREKPEVVAVGILKDVLGFQGALTEASGTSVAAPQVSGLAALLIDREPTLAYKDEALRAIIMSSAIHNIEESEVMDFQDDFDDRDGAGAIDCKTADDILKNNTYFYNIYNASDFPFNFYVNVTAPSKVRVAIAWSAYSDGIFDYLDADFDFYVYDPSSVMAAASGSFDNNYEIVSFDATETGTYRVEIQAPNFIASSKALAAAWTAIPLPKPELSYTGGAFSLGEAEQKTFDIELLNAGDDTSEGYLGISVSEGIKIVKINGLNFSESDPCGYEQTSGGVNYIHHIVPCPITSSYGIQIQSDNQLIEIVAPYNRNISRTFSVTVEGKQGYSGTSQWVKYRSSMLISDYPSQERDPESGDPDQQGWPAYKINVNVGDCTDGYEVNDTHTQASGPLNEVQTYEAKICSASDVDWFYFNASTSGPIAISFTTPEPSCYSIQLLNASLGNLGSIHVCGNTQILHASIPSADLYYIKVSSQSGDFNIHETYSFSYNITSGECTDGYEPNDSSSTAFGPFNPGNALNAKICTPGDNDWYKIRIVSPGTFSISFSVPAINCYDMELYDPSLTLLAGMGQCGTTQVLNKSVPAAGTYFVRVYATGGEHNTAHTYRLVFNFSPGGCNDPYEPNETPIEASGPLVSGTTYNSKICSGADLDWYKINISDTGIISLTMDIPSGKDYEMELYDSALNPIAGAGGGIGETEIINYAASYTGNYFIKIWSFDGNYDKNLFYNLTYNFTVQPTIEYTIDTDPSSLSITVDGKTYTSPKTFNWLPNTDHTIGVTEIHVPGQGIQHTYDHWSDGGNMSHTVNVPSTSATYTAFFNTQYMLSTAANPSEGGTVTPSGNFWHAKDTTVDVEATVNFGYSFTGWSGDESGTENPKNVLMNAPKTIIANFTVCPIPETPSNPSPVHGSTNLSVGTDLSWSNCTGAVSYDVYFGTSSPPAYLANTNENSYDLPILVCETQYFWKVVAKNVCGDAPGEEWNFTTRTCKAPDIIQLSPSSGPIGIPVRISGFNFGATQGTVTFNSITAAIFSWSETEVLTKVPDGATSGSVMVHTDAGQGSNGMNFIIKSDPTILVITPNGGESWTPGVTKKITWYAYGLTGNIKITLWKDGVWIGRIANNIDPNLGSHDWTVGQHSGGMAAMGSGYTIKIKEIGTAVNDVSDAPFTLSPLNVTSPNGGESWTPGAIKKITWDAYGLSGNLKITLWKDGVKVGRIGGNINPDLGYYDWTVGQHSGGMAAMGSGYTIKIKEIGTAVNDVSDAPFTLSPLNVTSPNGGESWTPGAIKKITWDAYGLSGNLKITLWKDGVKVGRIAGNINPNLGYYDWPVGQHSEGMAVIGTGYTIMIKEMGSTITDTSDQPFKLSPLNVTSPNGGESWALGTVKKITWDAYGLSANIKITLWKDGALVGRIANNINPSQGYYDWVVGQYSGGVATSGEGYLIKIKEIGTIISDMSDETFILIE
jgi:hypothetical protein